MNDAQKWRIEELFEKILNGIDTADKVFDILSDNHVNCVVEINVKAVKKQLLDSTEAVKELKWFVSKVETKEKDNEVPRID